MDGKVSEHSIHSKDDISIRPVYGDPASRQYIKPVFSEEFDVTRETQSAPCILLSKYVIEAFLEDNKMDGPRICDVNEFLSVEDIVEIHMQENINNRDNLLSIIDTKVPGSVPRGRPRQVYCELILEALHMCWRLKLSVKKASAMTAIYSMTHLYFIGSYWRRGDDVYAYFKELLLRHCVQHPPKSVEIFEYADCIAALNHFHRIYIRLLPVIRALVLPNFRLRLPWKLPPVEDSGKADKSKSAASGKSKGKKSKKGKN